MSSPTEETVLAPQGAKPQLNSMQGYVRGACTVCGKTAERQQTFKGPKAYDNWKKWEDRMPVHRRCEETT